MSSLQERVEIISLASAQVLVKLKLGSSHATRHRDMTSGSGGTIIVTGTLEEQGDDGEIPFCCDLKA